MERSPFDATYFKLVPGYESRYAVGRGGEVYSFRGLRLLKPRRQGSGYLQVMLARYGDRAWFLVHRLVAEAFVPNPEGLPQVNHINGDKTDNRAVNLEWVSMSENLLHRHRVLGVPGGRSKPVVCLETGAVYPSAKAAASALNVNRSGVSACCLGMQKSTKNLHFKFLEV